MKYFSVFVLLLCLCSPGASAYDFEVSVNPYELVDLESEVNMGIKTSYEASVHSASSYGTLNHAVPASEVHSQFTSDVSEESECSEDSTCP